MQAECGHHRYRLGKAARHAQDAQRRSARLRGLAQQRFGLELGAVVDGLGFRCQGFVDPAGASVRRRGPSIDRGGAGVHDAPHPGTPCRLDQDGGSLDIDPPERSLAGPPHVGRMQRGDITVHGFRSSFRDWAAEATDFPQEMAEMALAHIVGNKVEAAYRRGDMLEKRRAMMEAWAKHSL